MKFNYRKERKYFLDNTIKQLKKCLVFFEVEKQSHGGVL